MSKSIFSFFLSAKVFPLFYHASGYGKKKKSVCLIPVLAYEMFATKCFYHYVILSEYYHHCHFQLNSKHVLFVPRIFHILNKSNKGNFK